MQPGSSIINISSVLGITTGGLPQAAYSASKAGLNGLTRDLAQQWMERKGIRVNSIAPGFFESEMTDTYPDGYLDLAMTRVPARRKGDPAELGRDGRLPRLPRRRLHHRADAARRRRDDDRLTAGRSTSVREPSTGVGVEDVHVPGIGRDVDRGALDDVVAVADPDHQRRVVARHRVVP